MRRSRRVLTAIALAVAGVWVATALADHDLQHPFAGNWTTSYPEPPTSGTIGFRLVSDEEGRATVDATGFPFAKCVEPTDWYVGTFTRGGDSGTHVGCTYEPNLANAGLGLRMLFHSQGLNAYGLAYIAVANDGAAWGGNYSVYGNGPSGGASTTGDWSGAFSGHFAGDGAAAETTSAPTTGGATTGEEQPPPPCRATGAAPTCEEVPECAGKKATIYHDEDDPFGVPLIGTPGDDVIAGSFGGEVILGGGGNDLLCGSGGDDVINGAGGSDLIDGGGGDDRVSGAADDDTLTGGLGDDHMRGGAGTDTLVGGRGDDELFGGKGADRAFGGKGSDFILFSRFDDFADGGPGQDICARDAAGPGIHGTQCESGDF